MTTLLGCSDSTGQQFADQSSCIQISGLGQTSGNTHVLKGDGVFEFDGVARPTAVGLYLFEMNPTADGGFDVKTQYQFSWEGGDSFLTSDWVLFDPGLEPNKFSFNVDMTIVSGSGLFAGREGKTPIGLDAEITFLPPPNPGDLTVVNEQFRVSGRLCADQ